MSAVRAWPSMPSSREIRAVTSARGREPSRVARCQVTSFMYLCTDKSPGVARGARGGQHVIGARRLVAEGHRRFLAKEEGAVAGEPTQPPVEVGGLHLKMFGSGTVGDRRHFLAAVAEDDLGVIAPGRRRVLGVQARQGGDKIRYPRRDPLRERALVGDQPNRRRSYRDPGWSGGG